MSSDSKKAANRKIRRRQVDLKREQAQNTALVMMVAAALLLLIYAFSAPKKAPIDVDSHIDALGARELHRERQAALGKVNYHLKTLEQKISLERELVQLQHEVQMADPNRPRFDSVNEYKVDELTYTNSTDGTNLHLEQEHFSPEVLMDIQGFTVSGQSDDLQKPVFNYLADHQEAEHFNEVYRRAYVEKYIEDMRKAGYLVKINNNLEIIEIKRIQGREPSALLVRSHFISPWLISSQRRQAPAWFALLSGAGLAPAPLLPICVK